MNAFDYPVTEGFGYHADYPLNNGFHNGIDYGCPVGTPVIVNGVTIGLSGATGAVTGPHLHVGRWVGGTATDPTVGGGKNVSGAVVYDTGNDSTNGNYVRISDADGSLWVYLHLSKIEATKGQVLKGGNMPTIATKDIVGSLAYAYLNDDLQRNPSLDGYIGQPVEDVIWAFNGAEERANYLKSIEDKDKMIAALQLAQGDVEATTIGRALIKLFQTFGYKKS
jgi:hypothetical protein